MDVKSWLHCNIGCGQSMRLNPSTRFAFATCGHVICEKCAKKGSGNCCPVPLCKKPMKMILINNQSPQELKILLTELTDILSQQEKQVKQLLVQHQKLLLEKQEQQLRYLLEQHSVLLRNQEENVDQMLQRQKQQLIQTISFQKQQMKSYVDTTIQMIQRNVRQESKNEIEAFKAEWNQNQQNLAAGSRDGENNLRHSGASKSNHLFNPISTNGHQTTDSFKTPLPCGQFNHQQSRQSSAFAQNSNSFGGSKDHANVEFSQGRRSHHQHPPVIENTTGADPAIRLSVGSLGNQNSNPRGVQSQSATGAVRQPGSHRQQSRNPVPVNNGRISLEHRPSAFHSRSPASDAGSSIAGYCAISPTTSVGSGVFGRSNNRFYQCKK